MPAKPYGKIYCNKKLGYEKTTINKVTLKRHTIKN